METQHKYEQMKSNEQMKNNKQIKSKKILHHQDSLQKKARLNFIRKVYSILTMQFIITVAMCLVSYNVPQFLQFQIDNPALMWVSLGLILVIEIVIFCTTLGRKSPINLILLLCFTLFKSYIVSYICSLIGKNQGGQIVVIAAVMTLVIFIVLTIYAIFTKTDFTSTRGAIAVISSTLLVLLFISIFTQSPFLNKLYCALGAIAFGFFIIFDTEQIVGGKRKEITLDDFIMGALLLYIDIIQMFLYLLKLFSERR